MGDVASPLVGSCYTKDAPEGIEQVYADDLLAGKDVQLTIDSRMQQAAHDALGKSIGAAVVLDAETGAVLAMTSTPAYDPAKESADELSRESRSIELHIPGSTFKTITLAAALESGKATLDDVYPAPAEIAFPGGAVVNYDVMQYPDQTLLQAYVKSINTVFAQLTLDLGFENMSAQARAFGFDEQPMADFPARASFICGEADMNTLMQAWSGVGQALYQTNGDLQGPLMSPVQGAAIAAAVANGGTVYAPHVVASIDGVQTDADAKAPVLAKGISRDTADQLAMAMREVVFEGTGHNAAVAGVDVGGKTGTAETASSADDGWFIGFARRDGRCYAFAVLVEGAQSSEAAEVSARLIRGLFE